MNLDRRPFRQSARSICRTSGRPKLFGSTRSTSESRLPAGRGAEAETETWARAGTETGTDAGTGAVAGGGEEPRPAAGLIA